MKNLFPKDCSFIEVGKPVVIHSEKIIAYVIEISGETIITTAGSYKKEQLSSVITTYRLLSSFSDN